MNQQSVFQIFGHITVFFSTLDFVVTRCIIELVSDSYKNTRKPLKNSTTLGVKLRLIDELTDQDVVSADVLNEIKLALPEASSASEERNRFMHDLWAFNPATLEKGIINRMSLTDLKNWNTTPTDGIPYTYSDLEGLLGRIGALQYKFADALNSLKSVS